MRPIILASAAAAAMTVVSCSRAELISHYEDFSGGASTVGSWSSVGATATTIAHLTSPNDGNAAGDMVTGDGALNFNSVNGTQGDEAIAFNLSGTADLGQLIDLQFSVFNAVNSFHRGRYALYNATDNTELAGITIFQSGAQSGQDFQLVYTTQASDVDDTIQFRITEDNNSGLREIALDSFSATVPEPSLILPTVLGGIAFLRRRRKQFTKESESVDTQ